MSVSINKNHLVRAALGKTEADCVLENCQFLDVFSGKWRHGDLVLMDGHIVSFEGSSKARRRINLKNRWVVPGWIDSHVHVESSLMTPTVFSQEVVKRGTTTAVSDPHELANVIGKKGIWYFLEAAENLPLDLRVMLSSCVPATHFETNGGGTLTSNDLKDFWGHPQVLGLAEVMNVPGVLWEDQDLYSKIESALLVGKRVDGHAPLLRGQELSAYLCSGVSSCHESSELDEADEKISKGMAVWMREGSVAKDLDRLLPLLSPHSWPHLGFCTDDRNPLDIAEEGHIDALVRRAISKGYPPELVFASASLSPARHYGMKNKGAIAPGYVADLVVLNDVRSVSIEVVWLKGKPVSEIDFKLSEPRSTLELENSVRAIPPTAEDLRAPSGKVRVIGVQPGKILTDHLVLNSDANGVHRLSVLGRYGKNNPPANGYVFGFGESFQGAIGSSVGHDSHNLIAVGTSPDLLKCAFRHLIEMKGGFCVFSSSGELIADLPLPLGGLMTPVSAQEIQIRLKKLREASKGVGCSLLEPFLQLAFLSLPVIPDLKLTDLGLVDSKEFRQVSVLV